MLIIFMVGCSTNNELDINNEQVKRLVYTEVPFNNIALRNAPKRVKKWIEENKSIEQNKVFNVDGKTYVLILLGKKKTENFNVEITGIGETISIQYGEVSKGGMDIIYKVNQLKRDSNRTLENIYPFAIAEIDGEIEIDRSFQFSKKLTEDGLDEMMGDDAGQTASEDLNAQTDRDGSATELLLSPITPESLTEDGKVKDSKNNSESWD